MCDIANRKCTFFHDFTPPYLSFFLFLSLSLPLFLPPRSPLSVFQQIIRDLQVLGDTATISVTKDGVRFAVSGDLGTGNVLIRASQGLEDDDKDEVVIEM